MAQQTINTVIVLRNDKTTAWEKSEYVLLEGEVGIGYLEGGNVIAKLGDGEHAWAELPQIEGVLEKDLILTYNFGRHTTSNGFVNAGGKGMTTRQWLEDALSETKEPVITQPTFTLASDKKIQLTQESSKTYATITGEYTLDASGAKDPVNNVGVATTGKITDMSGTKTANVDATAYRKPFYGVLVPADVVDTSALSSAIIRGLPNSGTKTKGLPTSISVPAGSQMVIFAAKAGTYSSLTATDDKAMNATVTFEKKANAVKVEGANGFTAVDYDVWYVNWGAGIGSAKQLTLKWA